ncbi:uroporphyrinogen-III C-methyltransferase [Chelatococcus sp. SYSU_G07232]|uniref:uroporphyrinogen-III C-methyltransferase n=1 Tax=Chelatococcus albus TaxID=3047466 RepID=A0ABT7AJ51_9HYPH|nr:uroporphyrinogen-III C-methyltransferase [Chelatococcus sp. SYSU_G07232]MDJ1158844.1 uroporphyrinogen-III C-methyltransferase [Chelatococcus sp. SYSU_G07232]
MSRPALASLTPPFRPGEVWLVGAGPGDPGLLTLHALNALQAADVIVYDALVDERVLKLARPEARLEYAGKRGGKPSPRQADITLRLIALAREGLRVLRLKGGDPFVFGRGGEEALALVRAHVPFRLVPGVTAGLGGLGAALIPATTRGTNQALVLATGHTADGGPADLDWAALARLGQPIVLYMAMKNLPHITAELMAGGMSADTPLAVVAAATTAEERVLETTLGRAVADAAAAGLGAPAIVAIGSIVRLRAKLRGLAAQIEAESGAVGGKR